MTLTGKNFIMILHCKANDARHQHITQLMYFLIGQIFLVPLPCIVCNYKFMEYFLLHVLNTDGTCRLKELIHIKAVKLPLYVEVKVQLNSFDTFFKYTAWSSPFNSFNPLLRSCLLYQLK